MADREVAPIESSEEEEATPPAEIAPQQLGRKKLSRHKLHRYDSFEIESTKFRGAGHHTRGSKELSWSVILHLAFQSIGVVYGDIGTSPLYVYDSVFPSGIKNNEDVLGAFSLIFYTITLIPLIKYVLIVLRADDNGEGGTFALYSLICRYAKVGLIPSEQAEDSDVSNFKLELPSKRLQRASWLISKLENSRSAKYLLLFAAMLGTSMVIGDGILTPCISVLSAVGGLKQATKSMTEGKIVWISVAILVCLFLVQRFGTDKVGYSLAPIICLWFTSIGLIGLYNFAKYDPKVWRGLNPKYIVDYFKRNKKEAWVSLGGVVLAITGTEALFADLGHFTARSIQISMCSLTYPALIFAYAGQAAYLRKHNDAIGQTFYQSTPGKVYWPMFAVAVMAAIIASQAMISGAFSIIQQSLALGCFPRVKIVHTSPKYEGQVYIPEINYLLMILCVAVTLGFRTTDKIGNAYGIAVVFVMTLTSALLVLVMLVIWKTNILLVIAYVLTIGLVELIYLSSVLYKFDQGGYLPLAFSAILMLIMFIWNHVYRRKYHYELNHKISPNELKEIAAATNLSRLPGLAMFYSELVHGIPPIFKHYVENVPALHSVVVFVSIKSLPISRVPVGERFLFRRIEPKDLNVFRCVARYGYTDVHSEQEPFESMLVENLEVFIKEYCWQSNLPNFDEETRQEEVAREIDKVEKACDAGIVHLVGESEVTAGKGSNIGKRILIDYAFNFLKRNLRQSEYVFDIPHKRLLKVGMTYEL